MNITEFDNKTRYIMPVGTAILKENYKIASADEYFYKFIHTNTGLAFIDFIHEDDRAEFEEAAMRLAFGPQYVIVRFLTIENEYRIMLLKLTRDKRVVNGFSYINVYVDDIVGAMNKYEVNKIALIKYRRIMGLLDTSYFEYSFATNEFMIFYYANDKSYVMYRDSLDAWKDLMLEKYIPTEDDAKKLETLCMYLKDGVENFKLQFTTKFFSRSSRIDKVTFDGSTVFSSNERKLVAGVLTYNDNKVEQPYYATSAGMDAATGLMNKRAIMEYASHRISAGNAEELVLMVMDIDNFKLINDNYGHLYGDRVIQRIAETAKSIIGTRGVVARFGGDEFVVLLDKMDDESMTYLLETIFNNIKILFMDEYEELKVTISVGITKYPEDGRTYDELFLKADKALYVAKANGKNGYVVYNKNRHDNIEVGYGQTRIGGLKSGANNMQKRSMLTDILLELQKDGKKAVATSLPKLCDLFDINGINVFAGEKLENVCSFGKYIDKYPSLDVVEQDDYLKDISEYDVFQIADLSKKRDKSYYTYFLKNEISSTLHIIYRQDDEVLAIVTYDMFNTIIDWNDKSLEQLYTVGRLIGQAVN